MLTPLGLSGDGTWKDCPLEHLTRMFGIGQFESDEKNDEGNIRVQFSPSVEEDRKGGESKELGWPPYVSLQETHEREAVYGAPTSPTGRDARGRTP